MTTSTRFGPTMPGRRQLLLPLALAPVAGWAVWAAGAAEVPTHPAGPFHLPLDDTTALWRDLGAVRLGGLAGDPEFPTRVSALDGRPVTVRGFMIPLSDGASHNRFILSANPMGCPACQKPGPSSMIHVHSQIPLAATQEPLTLAGTLRLNPQEGLFYRLDRAEQRWA
ncbi:DUF3299 domain-containing protein [Azospirillum sp. TSO35-2]|uniref:DUF3299 domain-containing protein n=1 Tax=Azospirillum sp. TSO35-2 TaxID=716796 RepID=UPI000D61953D|nr:DUF3299 domain-containing protein [Azospirillum sp. TSO35-2]PWC39642.1 hypothetical protein TSO352_05890 [Azospirillum sp. TSO35-2]